MRRAVKLFTKNSKIVMMTRMEKTGSRARHIIKKVMPGGIAEEMGVEPGDAVVAINGQPLTDIFDYQFLMTDEEVTVTIEDREGERFYLEIEKEVDEDFGVEFEQPLMDNYRSCCNGCIFCFIDQMPPGMRKTLYFKDDDSRLSFLQGNYVTLTNMSDDDVARICRFRMEPINISIHTTDPALRVKMLKNKNAGTSLQKVRVLKEAGIEMNGQIVLCKGYNDGEALERTIRDCASYRPEMKSLSIVPVGLTKYREKLTPLMPFQKEDALQLIETVERWQDRFYKEDGNHFVYASDEWYILAGLPMPEADRYDGYPQLENGVGMIRSFTDDAREYLDKQPENLLSDMSINRKAEDSSSIAGNNGVRHFSAVTGYLAYPSIREIADAVEEKYPGLSVRIIPIRNDFFGNAITVAGLVTGTDLIAQCSEILKKEGKNALGETLLIPGEMLRADENVFLDDITIENVRDALHLPVRVLGKGGAAFVKMLLGQDNHTQNRRQYYEQTDRSDRGQTECGEIHPF